MTDIIFSELQERAIAEIVTWYGDTDGPQEFYLAGFAGTGKSTIVAEAIKRIKDKYKIEYVTMGAYTGKAAFILRKKGNANAQTIHSMIYKCSEDPATGEISFVINTLGAAAMADLIVLDECSMIDNHMANDLRSFNKKILVMGDPGQLPPINGEGSFTAREPDFFLAEIHRQAGDSPIIELATMARQGIMPPIGYSKGQVQVLPLTNQNAEHIHNPNTQVLCGLNRIRWAVTQIMRQHLGYTGEFPQPGERILCCKNNKEKGLFNGGAGILKNIELRGFDGKYYSPEEYAKADAAIKEIEPAWHISAEIEGSEHKRLSSDPFLFNQHFDNGVSKRNFKKRRPNEFDWGYIWSVHKAQGSSWRHVTLIDNSPSFREERWKHLYTAITRAEEGLVLLAS